MKIIDFITYVLKCNIFRYLASHEASGSKSTKTMNSVQILYLASHEASGSKSFCFYYIHLFIKSGLSRG